MVSHTARTFQVMPVATIDLTIEENSLMQYGGHDEDDKRPSGLPVIERGYSIPVTPRNKVTGFQGKEGRGDQVSKKQSER